MSPASDPSFYRPGDLIMFHDDMTIPWESRGTLGCVVGVHLVKIARNTYAGMKHVTVLWCDMLCQTYELQSVEWEIISR